MALSLDYTVIDNCENTYSSWTASANISNGADEQVYVSKQGSYYIGFHCAAAEGSMRSPAISPTVDIRVREIGIWFLSPYRDGRYDNVLFTSGTATQIRLRVFSSQSGAERWADYNQDQHIDFKGDWKGGWMYLRCSGDAGSEDANSGTWLTADAGAINGVALYLVPDNENTSHTQGSDPRYAIDWCIHYSKINVDGYETGTTPWTLQDIYDWAVDKASGGGEMGVVQKAENFYQFYCGLEFGDGTVAGAFTAENEYILLAQSSAAMDYDVSIQNNFTVTLGEENDAGVFTYAQNDVQLVVVLTPQWGTGTPSPDLIVASGGKLNAYATLIRGFNVVNLGSGGSGVIELVKVDFFDNVDTLFNSTGLSALNIRLHFPDGSEAAVGSVEQIPSSFEGIRVFQVTDGLEFRQTMDVEQYIAGDTTYDLVILEGKTLSLLNSDFSESKLKRVAT